MLAFGADPAASLIDSSKNEAPFSPERNADPADAAYPSHGGKEPIIDSLCDIPQERPAPCTEVHGISRRAALGGLAGLFALGATRIEAAAPAIDLARFTAGTAVPGMAAIVIRDFQARSELVTGIRRLGRPARCRPGDRWHLGSNGKAMTATLIARLVERRALSWSTPLDRMLPGLAASMHASYRDVTLPDLLSHRSGLPENHSDTAFFNSFYADRAPPAAQRLRYIGSALAEAPAVAKRGEMSYSNTGLLVAAACAERATGRPFEALIRAELFRPLGMNSPSFDQFGGAHEPSGHVDGRPAGRMGDPNPRMFAPAGAMRMSLSDWSRFCIDHMLGEHGSGRLLRTETYRFLHAGQGGTRSALGWGAAPSPLGLRGPALTHAGSDGNWYALVILFPETGNGALIVANAGESMGGDHAASAAIHALAMSLAPAAAAAAAS